MENLFLINGGIHVQGDNKHRSSTYCPSEQHGGHMLETCPLP
jgi:hypothetical protein